MPDLNANSIEAAMKIIEGTARNMGVAIEGVNDAELEAQHERAVQEEKEAMKKEKELEKMEESAKDDSIEVEVINEKKTEETE